LQDGTGWHYWGNVASGVTGPASLIQSDWITNGHGHFEAVVQQGSNLNHYVNLQDGTGWQYWGNIASGVSGPGRIIQSDWVSIGVDGNPHGHYEVLVQQGSNLNHYVNLQDGTGWQYWGNVATGVTGPASLIQSNWVSIGVDGNPHGHFEAMFPQGGNLVHYVNLQDGSGWLFWEIITNGGGVGAGGHSSSSKPSNMPRPQVEMPLGGLSRLDRIFEAGREEIDRVTLPRSESERLFDDLLVDDLAFALL
jgi:hypothetical protein